ncbi:MAG: acetoacetate--CoA ligase [Thermoanaerobaculia bacterium]
MDGKLLWEPSQHFIKQSNLSAYLGWLRDRKGLSFDGYSALWSWSVTEIEAFWQSIADYFELEFHAPASRVLSGRKMPGPRWFEGAELNYAEHALKRGDEHPALIYRSEDGRRVELSYAELRRQVAGARAGLRRLGVQRGDRVVGFIPNAPEAVVALLATASLGAIWSSCPPEFGVQSVLDRFLQIEPKVLVAVDGYPYNGRTFDRRKELEEIVAALASLERTVLLARLGGSDRAMGKTLSWEELLEESGPLEFDPVPFEHPLWILYSSGTTGLPKPIVHGHGGILLELYKQLALQSDLKPGDRFFWYTTTGWMMWNYLVSGLLLGATPVLYEGAPTYPDLMGLWRLVEEEGISYFGTSAPFLMACRKAGLSPRKELSLRSLKAIGSTGAPLPAEGFHWVYEQVKEDLWLGSLSGGTDVCTAFVGPCPLVPVRAGEIQSNALGAKVEAFDPDGRPVVDQVGELVLTEPLPSMPVFFWNDEGGERYRASYFDTFPGVWRHGDWIKIGERGGSVIYGRSDSTLNRGGVRMGTSEFYRVIEGLPEVAESVVVDTGSLVEEGRLWLFVVPAEGQALDEELRRRIRALLRTKLSPRHVPDEILAIPEVPKTLSGKKLEVPLKRILTGTPLEEAVNPGTLSNPESIRVLLEATRTVPPPDPS